MKKSLKEKYQSGGEYNYVESLKKKIEYIMDENKHHQNYVRVSTK